MRVKGVIFDCDGTLLDSMSAWHSVEARLAENIGITLSKEEKDALNGNTPKQTAAYFHAKYGYGTSPEDIIARMYDELAEAYREEIEPRAGAVELVEELRRNRIRMTVVSSSPGRLLRIGLARAGILECFDAVISTDDLGISKRGPLAVRHAQSIMHTVSDETWGFEDSTYALKVLRAQGFGTVGIYDNDISGTYNELANLADVTVRELTELNVERFVAGDYRPVFA